MTQAPAKYATMHAMRHGVSIAEPADAPDLFNLLSVLHRENGMAPMSEEKVAAKIAAGVNRSGAVIGVIRGDKRIEASIGLFISTWWYSDSLHIEDLWAVVHPDYRNRQGAGHARRLLEFAKHVGAELGLPVLTGVLSTERTAGKVRLYRRQLPEVGALFLQMPPEATAEEKAA